MTTVRLRSPHAVILVWTTVSFLAAMLPPGVGGVPRAVNAVLFMTLGPGCALMITLLRSMPLETAASIAIGASLTVLVLSSQGLLIMGLWSTLHVAALVALATISFTLVSVEWRGR